LIVIKKKRKVRSTSGERCFWKRAPRIWFETRRIPRILGAIGHHRLCVSLNSRLESNKEDEKKKKGAQTASVAAYKLLSEPKAALKPQLNIHPNTGWGG